MIAPLVHLVDGQLVVMGAVAEILQVGAVVPFFNAGALHVPSRLASRFIVLIHRVVMIAMPFALWHVMNKFVIKVHKVHKGHKGDGHLFKNA